MLIRLLVLWLATLLVAVPADATVEPCCDVTAASVLVDEAYVAYESFDVRTTRQPALHLAHHADAIPPAPARGRVFRPPRGGRD